MTFPLNKRVPINRTIDQSIAHRSDLNKSDKLYISDRALQKAYNDIELDTFEHYIEPTFGSITKPKKNSI